MRCVIVKSFPKPLSTSEETEYLMLCKGGDKEARDILIERNLRLVAHIVKKYASCDKETDDLISIGTIGLIKAIDTFNVDKGIRLATYEDVIIGLKEKILILKGFFLSSNFFVRSSRLTKAYRMFSILKAKYS